MSGPFQLPQRRRRSEHPFPERPPVDASVGPNNLFAERPNDRLKPFPAGLRLLMGDVVKTER